jgi:DnaJ-domain-containing protein 1
MDLWQRLDRLVRSWMIASESDAAEPGAWEELEAFLRREHFADSSTDTGSSSTASAPPPQIRQALTDLELAVGASPEEIRSAYRRQLKLYHPDRFGDRPEQARRAVEVTHRLTVAYQTLRDYYG